MKNKIAILITTFLRNELLKENLSTIIENSPDNSIILIADQNKIINSAKALCNNSKIKYYHLPYDCGLSFARNFLVDRAKELNCNYCWLMADSISFVEKYNITPILDFLDANKDLGIVGLDILKRVSWERDIELIKGKHFWLKIPKRIPIIYKDIKFQQCDIIRNFFIAKTECLLSNRWDENFKLLEHEDYFWRLKQTNWQVFFTDYIQTEYKDYKPFEYSKMRDRMYKEFLYLLQQKYNISGWVKYER